MTKNSTPSSEFEHEDRCPSCGSPCNVLTDLDDNDYCNDCKPSINNKQSSVDFYAEQSLNLFNLFQQGQISINEFRTKMYEVEIQSTKIHEEEIEDAFQAGKWDWAEHITNGAKSKDLVQYYNETYGGNK